MMPWDICNCESIWAPIDLVKSAFTNSRLQHGVGEGEEYNEISKQNITKSDSPRQINICADQGGIPICR